MQMLSFSPCMYCWIECCVLIFFFLSIFAFSARPASGVSKSVSVLDISGNEKSARTPQRFSIPSKSSACPAAKSFGNITPIYEARGRRSDSNNRKSDTPVSDVSRSSSRKKFSVVSSASYWLSQIKLSESANKHSVSLGFFKLALETGCEPMQWMKDEFKAYVLQPHNMSEFGESMKELIESYKILEGFEQLQISGTSSEAKTCPPQISQKRKSRNMNKSTFGSGSGQ
ncbi:uncharacterized protein LOC142513572 [Primulina tabacum]|uniref:uncharacterized protein LOC142513572 n=1 Tax=Primulina tabacum TaxID=48773 RepID=UPI003F596923